MRIAPTAACLAAALFVCVACSDSSDSKSDTGTTADASVGDGTTGDGTSADAKVNCKVPPPPKPGSCASDPMPAFKGQYQVVMNTLVLASEGEGFDLNNADCDDLNSTGADNSLWPIGVLGQQSIDESIANGEITIPMEFYGLDDVKNDDCVNFAIYLGRFPIDGDGDGAKAGGSLGKPGKDCNDNDKAINHKAAEIPGNGVDDNCNGLADEDTSKSPPTPSTDTTDADGDGQTIADGDCDDRKGFGETIKKGGTEICGDGLDNDCNGTADDGCLPWSKGQHFPIEDASLKNGTGAIVFRGARIKDGKLIAGPSLFSVAVEVARNVYFDLNLSNVFVEADIKKTADGIAIENGQLGGVLSARALDQAPNLIAEIGSFGRKEDSLLDALVGPAGQLLALPTNSKGQRVPDVDVDGDGIEVFIDSDLDGDKSNFRVDTCIDGDGTVIKDTFDKDGKVLTRCTEAKDSKGNYRFVDGWSIGIKFTALKATIKGTVKPAN